MLSLKERCEKFEQLEDALRFEIENRKKIEIGLRERLQKYRNLFDNAIGGMFQSSQDGKLIFANPEFARILGFESSEALMEHAKGGLERFYVNLGQRRELIQSIRRDGIVRRFEADMYRKDGSIATVLINAQADYDEDGRLSYLAGTVEDITGLKDMGREKKELEAHLVRSQKMEAIGTLAGGIAHDFNNILTSVLGFAELARFDLPQADSRPRQHIEQVIKAGLRAKELVQHLLAFSRSSETKKEAVRLSPLIKETAKLLNATLPSGIEIRTRLPSADATVHGDPAQIHQILMNLCLNAAQALAGNGGAIEICLEKANIAGSSQDFPENMPAGDYIRLSVSDNGPGIPQDIVHKVFDPFFTTKSRPEGSGMGLAVVHGIVKEMNGTIGIESNANQGAVFSIILPQHLDGAKTEILVDEVEPYRRTGRILFVDDEESIAIAVGGILERVGYDVATSADGNEALKRLRAATKSFDLVITDLDMPEMTGLELSSRAQRIHPEVPVLLCTGFSRDITQKTLSDHGICELVLKPVIASKLIAAVERCIKSKP